MFEHPFASELSRKEFNNLSRQLDLIDPNLLMRRQDEIWNQHILMAERFPQKCNSKTKKWFQIWALKEKDLVKSDKLEATRMAKSYASIIFEKMTVNCKQSNLKESVNADLILSKSECNKLFILE